MLEIGNSTTFQVALKKLSVSLRCSAKRDLRQSESEDKFFVMKVLKA
jgi:hypothetical protein